MENMDEQKAQDELKKGYDEAEKLLNEKDKLEDFLQKAEKKLKTLPIAGDSLAMIPTMVSLIKSYIKKEYTEIPVGSIIAVISALLYWLSAIDLIPDILGPLGYTDDALVIVACLKLVGSDIEDYAEWRKKNNKLIEN